MQPLIYLFGLVGLAAFALLPIRSWRVVSQWAPGSRSTVTGAIALLNLVAIVAAALLVEAVVAHRVLVCLTGMHCGPTVGHGLLYLAALGLTYIAFEVLAALFSWAARVGTRRAA